MISLNDYLELFPPSARRKPRFLALVSAVLSQAVDLCSLVQAAFPEAWNPDTAEGVQLDGLGVLLNTPRPDAETSDADYRFLLRAKMAVHRWNGTNETLPDVLQAALPGLGAKLIDNQDGTVTVSASGTAPFALSDLVPVPAGVRMISG